MAAAGSPPMSVPHLDTRDHRRQALAPVRPLCRLLDQVPEARLAARPAAVDQAGQHPAAARRGAGQLPARGSTWSARCSRARRHRFKALREFYPNVKESDWELDVAGQRVQIIKKDANAHRHPGVRHRDRAVGRLLARRAARRLARRLDRRLDHGAHAGELLPRASWSASWVPKLKEMIPSYGGRPQDRCRTGRAGPQGHRRSAGAEDGLMSCWERATPWRIFRYMSATWRAPRGSIGRSLDVVLRFGAVMLRSGDTAFRVRDAMGLAGQGVGIEPSRGAHHHRRHDGDGASGRRERDVDARDAPLGVDASRIAALERLALSSKPGLTAEALAAEIDAIEAARPRCTLCADRALDGGRLGLLLLSQRRRPAGDRGGRRRRVASARRRARCCSRKGFNQYAMTALCARARLGRLLPDRAGLRRARHSRWPMRWASSRRRCSWCRASRWSRPCSTSCSTRRPPASPGCSRPCC